MGSRLTDITEWLGNQIVNLPAFGVVPEDRPERFITIERTGGDSNRFIDNATYAVQVWASSILEADQLATQLRDACWLLLEQPWVAAVSPGNLYDFTDPQSGHYRYQFTLEIGVMNHQQ